MSAATTWNDLEPATCPSRGTAPGRRHHLRLVPTGPDVRTGRHQRTRSRLTRRGRLAVTLLVTAAVVTLAVSMASGLSTPTAVAQPAVTVSAGQTLSDVAVAKLPQLPVREAVVQLQLANDLTSMQVHAGQVLVIPTTFR